MKRLLNIITLVILLSSMPVVHCHAGVEPNAKLAWAILENKKKYESALKAQRRAQELMAEGHVFTWREVQATNEYIREFDRYLDSFHESITLAAELFGTFLEVKRTVKLAGQVSSIISSAPSNAIAVMLQPSTSGLYRSILNTSLDAAQNIYDACLSKQKRTEQDRNKSLELARKKIKKVNSDLTRLIIVLKYTSFEDIWYSVRERAKFLSSERKHAIVERCFDNWKHNRSMVRVN